MNASVAPPKPGMQPSTANIQLMQLTTAYWTSRCLHVVAELGVADHLGDQPQSTESLAKATGTSAGPLYRVLRLLASVGVFDWKDGTWHHTEASRFLRSDEPGSLRDYVRMLGLTVFWSAFEGDVHGPEARVHPAVDCGTACELAVSSIVPRSAASSSARSTTGRTRRWSRSSSATSGRTCSTSASTARW